MFPAEPQLHVPPKQALASLQVLPLAPQFLLSVEGSMQPAGHERVVGGLQIGKHSPTAAAPGWIVSPAGHGVRLDPAPSTGPPVQ